MKILRGVNLAILVIFACSVLCAQQPQAGASPAHAPLVSTVIPRWSRVYIDPMPESFDRYIRAAIQQNNVPVVLVSELDQAEFEISGSAKSRKAGAAKILILGSWRSSESATIQVVSRKDKSVVFEYSYHNWNSAHGRKSSAEACAKHLKKKIESGK